MKALLNSALKMAVKASLVLAALGVLNLGVVLNKQLEEMKSTNIHLEHLVTESQINRNIHIQIETDKFMLQLERNAILQAMLDESGKRI